MKTKLMRPLAATLIAAGLACGRQAAAPAPVLPTASVLLVPSAPPGGHWVAASLEAKDQAVLASRFAASIKTISAREGDSVKAGQLLAQLDDGDLRGTRDAARAALTAAQAQQTRIAQLFAQQAATQAELDQANTQLAQAKAALDGAQANLRYTELRAPFAGTLRSRSAEPGSFVSPGQPILTLDGGGLELRASLTESESARIKPGQEIAFTSGDREGKARVLALASSADPLTHRRDLRATVLSASGLSPGAFARIRVDGVEDGTSIWLPDTSLVQRNGLSGVFVVENGHAVLRWLSLGEQQGGRVEARAGLKPGEAVVDRPGDLRDGQPVEASHGR